jgi:hypothetical protein
MGTILVNYNNHHVQQYDFEWSDLEYGHNYILKKKDMIQSQATFVDIIFFRNGGLASTSASINH